MHRPPWGCRTRERRGADTGIDHLLYVLARQERSLIAVYLALSPERWERNDRDDLIILDKDVLETDGLRPFASLQEDVDMPLLLLVAHEKEEGQKGRELSEERLRAFEPRHLRGAEAILRRLRRLLEEKRTVLKVGQLTIDFEKKQATFYDKSLALTPIKFNLLSSLALDAGRVMEYRELLETVWGYKKGRL